MIFSTTTTLLKISMLMSVLYFFSDALLAFKLLSAFWLTLIIGNLLISLKPSLFEGNTARIARKIWLFFTLISIIVSVSGNVTSSSRQKLIESEVELRDSFKHWGEVVEGIRVKDCPDASEYERSYCGAAFGLAAVHNAGIAKLRTNRGDFYRNIFLWEDKADFSTEAWEFLISGVTKERKQILFENPPHGVIPLSTYIQKTNEFYYSQWKTSLYEYQSLTDKAEVFFAYILVMSVAVGYLVLHHKHDL